MLDETTQAEPGVPRAMRALLLLILTLGMLGTAADLLLLDHYENVWQVVPLVLIATGLATVAAVTLRSGWLWIAALRIVMVLFLAAGALGILLHYRGNSEFQREMDPSLDGWALVVKVMTAKAPPALAPASMMQLGMIGLLYTYRHPALTRSLSLSNQSNSSGV